MKKTVIIAIMAVCVLCISTLTKADITIWAGKAESDGFQIDSSNVFGGAVGFSFIKYFGVEFVVDYMPDAALPGDIADLADQFGVDVNMDMLFLSGNIVVQMPLQEFTPFATAGYGAFGVRLSAEELADVEDELSGTTFFNLGAGAKFNVGPFAAIRGEWRMYRLNYDREESGNALIFVEDNPVFNRFSIGVALTF